MRFCAWINVLWREMENSSLFQKAELSGGDGEGEGGRERQRWRKAEVTWGLHRRCRLCLAGRTGPWLAAAPVPCLSPWRCSRLGDFSCCLVFLAVKRRANPLSVLSSSLPMKRGSNRDFNGLFSGCLHNNKSVTVSLSHQFTASAGWNTVAQ